MIERMCDDGAGCYDLGGVDTRAAPGSKGAAIMARTCRYGGVPSHHNGGIRTLDAARAGLHARLPWLCRRG